VDGVVTPSNPLRIASAALVAAVALVATGSGVAGARVATTPHVTKTPTVKTKKVATLGTILVNSKGRTLYMFVPDHQKKVTCKGQCAVIWPPLKIKQGQKPTAGGTARQKLLGTDKNPGGGRVVTYNHWPLYTYVTDTKPGQTTGQGVNNSGGKWYVLSPSGKVIKKK
jgi:predicted lipoprotein with Yx(FWY)xxD motif